MEFVEREEEYSLVNLVERNKNIFIIKAATKFFGMPGLRLGYGVCSDKELLENMYNLKEPWSINSFADNLSNYIFKNKDYIKSSKDFYIKERKFMVESLKKISSIKVFETDTNFILIKLKIKAHMN
ncbi:aminotransferase class I and II family protein [[Clostridium] sordellii ATCC 9714]|nr:aminotransferase class I and II family protein [[Clostridium] sordellii ATCC 9714] [Paeniclostridium sordellii ATCC 9714]